MNKSTEWANAIQEHFGFLVMNWRDGQPVPKIGDVLRNPSHGLPQEWIEGPFVVVGYASEAEAKAQRDFIGPRREWSCFGETKVRLKVRAE